MYLYSKSTKLLKNTILHFISKVNHVFKIFNFCRKHQVKQNIVWNDNDTVTYQIQDQYKYFIPELSNGNLTDRVTNLNVITMVSKFINLVSYRYYINVV